MSGPADNRGGIDFLRGLFDVGKLVFAALDEAWFGDGFVFRNFDAIDRDCIAREELASFALARCEFGSDEDIYEILALFGGWEALGE